MRQVLIGKNTYSLQEVQENLQDYAQQLKAAHQFPGHAFCLCNATRPKLVIRQLDAGFILARWPRTGNEHLKGTCPFYRDDPATGVAGGDSEPAFVHTQNGVDVKIDVAVNVKTTITAGGTGQSHGTTGGASRRSATLLAFLEFAWEQANLHKWYGDSSRKWAVCFSLLSGALTDGVMNGARMDEILHIMEPFEISRKTEIETRLKKFITGIGVNGNVHRRGFFVGEIKEIRENKHNYKVILRHSSIGSIFVTKDIYEDARNSYGLALPSANHIGNSHVAILALERQDNGYMNVIALAAMLTNKAYLPCDSSYEVQLADRLIAEKRHFDKPLRHVGNAPVHPDFVLNDVANPTVIEVYGVTGDAKYDQRKAVKRAHYQEEGIRCVEWHPVTTRLESLELPSADTSE